MSKTAAKLRTILEVTVTFGRPETSVADAVDDTVSVAEPEALP